MKDERFPDIRACVFDVYGTLLDFNAAVEGCRDRLGDRTDELSALWRRKQLEYTWLRSLMGHHIDFWQVTADALGFACETLSIADEELEKDLMALYRELDCYPEVPETLKSLREAGLATAVLSNGAPEMLEEGLTKAGIRDQFDVLLSAEDGISPGPPRSAFPPPGSTARTPPSKDCPSNPPRSSERWRTFPPSSL